MLASASPARRFLLESAGLDPEVMVSHADETGTEHLPTVEAVEVLARRKAETVAARFGPSGDAPLVLACDSLLEFEGCSWGKPGSAAEVIDRWSRLRGRSGLLHTGHVLIDAASGTSAHETDTALVRFGLPTDEEIAAYSATPEALQVAGPFTLEGRSSPWIESIDGNYGTITGVSLAVLRRLLGRVGIAITDLWNERPR